MDKTLQTLKDQLADTTDRNMRAQIESQDASRAESAARAELFKYVKEGKKEGKP